jgi:hypothetical protein
VCMDARASNDMRPSSPSKISAGTPRWDSGTRSTKQLGRLPKIPLQNLTGLVRATKPCISGVTALTVRPCIYITNRARRSYFAHASAAAPSSASPASAAWPARKRASIVASFCARVRRSVVCASTRAESASRSATVVRDWPSRRPGGAGVTPTAVPQTTVI